METWVETKTKEGLRRPTEKEERGDEKKDGEKKDPRDGLSETAFGGGVEIRMAIRDACVPR